MPPGISYLTAGWPEAYPWKGWATALPVERTAIREPQPLAGCTYPHTRPASAQGAHPPPANPRVSAKAALAA